MASGKYIQLIYWWSAEAEELAVLLRARGYAVDHQLEDGFFERMRRRPPAAAVIDLNRVPDNGRNLALFLRRTRATRRVPLVFLEGTPAQVDLTRTLLPDAVYTSRARIAEDLAGALAHPPADPVVPPSDRPRYSRTPLAQKLGIKPGSVAVLVRAPRNFEDTLGRLPKGAVLRRQARGPCDLVLWFVTARKDLERRIGKLAELAGGGSLWVLWRKKAAGLTSDLSERVVREVGLAAGLVDSKVCAVDATWSGLRFARRREASPRTRAAPRRRGKEARSVPETATPLRGDKR